jgi:HEAT repeat protein
MVSMSSNQLDLFETPPEPTRPSAPAMRVPTAVVVPADLTDEALIAAVADAAPSDIRGLASELERRRPRAAVPTLAALCRRFSGFGATRLIVEQVVALETLAVIGGSEAALAVRRAITTQQVQGPNLAVAMRAAAALSLRLPREVILMALQAEDRDLREAACGCAGPDPQIVAALRAALTDIDEDVGQAAACALGRLGRVEALPPLIRELERRPTTELIESIAPVADETAVVILGRLARTRPEFRQAAIAALEDCAASLAAHILQRLPPDSGE